MYNWYMSDVECNGILSHDCGADDEDSPKKVIENIQYRQVEPDNGFKKFISNILHNVYEI